MDNLIPARFTLVSASPRRSELVAKLGIPFDVAPSDAEELMDGAVPRSLAAHNARLKVEGSAHYRERGRLLLGADTLIAFHARIFGKPNGLEDARRMLTALAGQVHEVITGVCMSGPASTPDSPFIQVQTAAVTRVRFRALTSTEIQTYLDSGEWEGKAGAYAIQGVGGSLIAGLDGDYDNVVGLPIQLIHDLLDTHYRHCRFCKELREARDYQRITLREIAAVTRLGLEPLQAIEEGRWDDIPRAYLRGYLGLYAQAVGMNVEKVLRSFDRLMLPEGAAEAAILDEAPPLLREPQAVGLTRAKIRTTWFAVLSRNRKLLYLLSFLAVAGLFGLLNLTRRIEDRRAMPMIPFSEALAENKTRMSAPLITVPLDSAQMEPRIPQRWVSWVGSARGMLAVRRDRDSLRFWRLDAFDTVKIQYVDSLVARVYPARSAMAFRDTAVITASRTLPGDTAFYSITPGTPVHPDTTKTNLDSLAKG